VLAEKRYDVFRLLARDVDPDFLHGLDRKGIQSLGFNSRTQRFELVSRHMPEIPLRHLAPS
jgi:hypothetical protein